MHNSRPVWLLQTVTYTQGCIRAISMDRHAHARAEAEWQHALELEKRLKASSRYVLASLVRVMSVGMAGGSGSPDQASGCILSVAQ